MTKTAIFFVAFLSLFSIGNAFSQSIKPPHFPGGDKMLGQYLNENLKWPKSDEGDSQGIVIIGFFVEKDGSLTDIKVAKSMAPAFDTEALRVVAKSPKWVSARRDGKPIRSKYTLPIKFFIYGNKQ